MGTGAESESGGQPRAPQTGRVRLRWACLSAHNQRLGAALVLSVLAGAGCRRAAPAPPVGAAPLASPPAVAKAPPATSPAEVEAAVAARPDDYELRMNAAQYYMLQGRNAAAVPHLQAAVRLQPDLALPWIALGDARGLSGRDSAARAAYARARRLAPGDPLIDRGLGQLLIREGRLAAGRALLAAAVRRHPESVDLRLALGNLYLVLNQPADAIETLRPAARNGPASADVHYLLGQAYERSLHIEAALREQEAAVAADPNFDAAYGRIGIYLIDLTRYAEARPPLQQAIRLNPRESHYYWALGDSYLLDAGDPAHLGPAIDLYHQALGIDPHNEKALLSLALALTRRGAAGDLPEATRVLARVIRQDPSSTSAYYKLYETEARLGRSTAAQRALNRFRLLESQGRHQTAHQYQTVAFVDTAAAHLRLGQRDLAGGHAALAATEFRLALQRDSRLAAARAGLAQALRRQPSTGPGK